MACSKSDLPIARSIACAAYDRDAARIYTPFIFALADAGIAGLCRQAARNIRIGVAAVVTFSFTSHVA